MSEVAKLQAEKLDELQEGRDPPLHGASRAAWAAARAAGRRAEKEIIKEGLSEYFIYTIEGTETIPNGWSKRLRRFEAADGAVQDPVPLPPAGIRRAARADVPADQRREVEARHDAAARRRRARVPRQRPRRALVPDAAGDQVHPDRRQDRAEPGPRSGSDLRADQAPRLPRRALAADPRHQRVPQGRRRRRSSSEENASSPAGTTTRSSRQRIRNYTGKDDRGRNPPHASPATSSSAASSSRSCTTTRRSSS